RRGIGTLQEHPVDGVHHHPPLPFLINEAGGMRVGKRPDEWPVHRILRQLGVVGEGQPGRQLAHLLQPELHRLFRVMKRRNLREASSLAGSSKARAVSPFIQKEPKLCRSLGSKTGSSVTPQANCSPTPLRMVAMAKEPSMIMPISPAMNPSR